MPRSESLGQPADGPLGGTQGTAMGSKPWVLIRGKGLWEPESPPTELRWKAQGRTALLLASQGRAGGLPVPAHLSGARKADAVVRELSPLPDIMGCKQKQGGNNP